VMCLSTVKVPKIMHEIFFRCSDEERSNDAKFWGSVRRVSCSGKLC